MHAAYRAEQASPFAAQAAVTDAISGYRTRLDMSMAHSNCLAMLACTRDPNAQVFLQSCLIALRRKLSQGAYFGPSTSPSPPFGGPAPESHLGAGGPDSSER